MLLQDFLPYAGIENDILFCHDFSMTKAIELHFPDVYTISAEAGNKLNNKFDSILRMMPPGSIFHLQDYYDIDYFHYDKMIGSLAFRSTLEHFDYRSILKHSSILYITFKINNPVDKNHKSSSANNQIKFLRLKELDTLKKDADKILELANAIVQSLNNYQGIQARLLNKDEIKKQILRYFNLDFNTKNDLINPIHINDSLKVGDKYVNILSMRNDGDTLFSYSDPQNGVEVDTSDAGNYMNNIMYDNEVSRPVSFVYPLHSGLPIKHITNTIIELHSSDDMFYYMKKKSSEVSLQRAFMNPKAKSKQQKISAWIENCEQHNYQGCIVKKNVIVDDADISILKNKTDNVKRAFENCHNLKYNLENKNTGALFISSAPGCGHENFRTFVSTTRQAACYIPKESVTKNDPHGYIFTDRHHNKPIVFNLMEAKKPPAKHGVIFGPTGSGKSIFCNIFTDQSLSNNYHIVIIDVGGSYNRLIELWGGKKIDWNNMQNAFNPFLCSKDDNGSYIYTDESEDLTALDEVFQNVKMIWKGQTPISNEEKNILKNIITDYYNNVNSNNDTIPKLSDFYDFLSKRKSSPMEEKYFDKDSILLMLKPFAKGQYAKLLNSDDPLDIEKDQFVVFDAKSINEKDDIRDLVMLNIMNIAKKKMEKLPVEITKLFLIDEAVDFLEGDFGDYIGALYRKARKQGGAVWIATQSVNFLKAASDKVRDSILDNLYIKILLGLGDKEASIKDNQKWLSLTDNDVEFVRSLKDGDNYREFYMNFGGKNYVFRNELSPVSYAVYNTDKDPTAEINNLKKERGLRNAINQFVENHKND